MAKKVETKETLDSTFEGFKFLDSNTDIVKDDVLSEDEIKLIEDAAKANAGIASKEDDGKPNPEEGEESKGKEDLKKETTDSKEEVFKQTEEQTNVNPYLEFASYMNEKGILYIDENEKIESEEDLERITANTVKKEVENYKNSLPEDGQKFLDFIQNGGNPSDFHKYYYQETSFKDFDLESEENQKYVVEQALKLEDYSDEEIKEEIELLEDAGRLEKKAQTFLKRLQKVEDEQKQTLLEAQKKYAKEQEDKRIQEWDQFKKGLFDKDAIGGFKITPKVKNDLWDYMTKPVDKKTGETQYQKDSISNEDARYVFAYLLKNKWDVSSLEKMVETKKVGELKSKLSGFTDSRNKQRGPSTNVVREEDNPFSGFKKYIN